MEKDFYNLTLQILYIVCLFASIGMFFFPSEKKKEFAAYTRSRYIAGIVFLLYAILCFVDWRFEVRNINKLYASAFGLSIYYLSGILFGFSLTPLLNKNYFCRRRIVLDSVRYLIFLVIISLVFLLKRPYATIAIIVATAYFFGDALRISLVFLKSYRKCVKDINNYYSEYSVESYVHWMYKVSVLIIIYGLSFTFVSSTNKEWIAAFSFLGIFMIAYIAICYNNYLMYVEKINQSQENNSDENEAEGQIIKEPLSYAEIECGLQTWIEERGFLKERITIASLCTELNTNRTYLSYYINNTYGCSFRDFISRLRIDEAKRLLIEDFSKDINEIAITTGFSSTSNFYRTFRKFENKTPAAYRDAIASPARF